MLFIEAATIPGLVGAISLLAFFRDPEQKVFNVMLIILWCGAAFLDMGISALISAGCLFMACIYLYRILTIPKDTL